MKMPSTTSHIRYNSRIEESADFITLKTGGEHTHHSTTHDTRHERLSSRHDQSCFQAFPELMIWANHSDEQDFDVEVNIIPGIPKTFVADLTDAAIPYTPDDIFNIRHLPILDRRQAYLEFHNLKVVLNAAESSIQKTQDVWELLMKRSSNLLAGERKFYSVYKDRAYSDEEENKYKNGIPPWHKVLNSQSKSMRKKPTGGYEQVPQDFTAKSFADQERVSDNLTDGVSEYAHQSLRQNDCQQVVATAPPAQNENEVDASLYQSYEFDTSARDQMHRHKKERAVGDAPKYKAENLFTGTGTGSKYDWEASGSEFLEAQQREKALENAIKSATAVGHVSSLTAAENAVLHHSKRRWEGDLVPLPDYPSTDTADYSMRADGNWRCLHEDFNCVDASCKHRCCKDGYATEGKLKTAIRRAEATWKSKVEGLIRDKLLSKHHKTWNMTKNNSIRKQEIRNKLQ